MDLESIDEDIEKVSAALKQRLASVKYYPNEAKPLTESGPNRDNDVTLEKLLRLSKAEVASLLARYEESLCCLVYILFVYFPQDLKEVDIVVFFPARYRATTYCVFFRQRTCCLASCC